MADPYERSNERITSLILEGGRARGESERRRAEGWGGLIQGVGQAAAGAIQQHAEAKKQQQVVQQMAKRDAAWVGYLKTGEWQRDPKGAYQQAITVWGHQEGPKQFEALEGVKRLQRGERDNARKDLGVITGAMDKMGDAAKAEVFPQLRELTMASLGTDIGEAYDPAKWPEYSAIGAQFRGESVKTREVKIRNADGSESIKIVKDEAGQDFTSAAPEPKMQRVTVPGPGGPMEKLVTEDQLKAGVATYQAPKSADNEPLMAIKDPNNPGETIYVPRSEAKYKNPASSREQGRPVTSGDAGRIADYKTSLDDLAVLKQTLAGNKATGMAAKAGAGVWNPITEFTGWGSDAKSKQATIDRVKQVIGKALEGGVLRKEDEYKYEKILPTIGDPPPLVASKLEGLQSAIEQRNSTLIDSLGDAGYDTSKYLARAGAPRTERIGAGPWEGKGGAAKPQKVGRFTVRVK